MGKILVTGGTGYIGSHTLIDLIEKDYEVICVDNQYNSELSVLDRIEKITKQKPINYSVDLCDYAKSKMIFEKHKIDAIIHFAAYKSVAESVDKPLEYYHNNLISLHNLIDLSKKYSVSKFIFSSSCAVYGNAKELPVTEITPFQEAESPYARSKQVGEYMIKDFARANTNFSAVVLRYFNPAGAHPSACIGESSRNKASNLVPVITETAIGKRDSMNVFGVDYETRDGSCIRDYLHVMDLADAHSKSIQYLSSTSKEDQVSTFNLGIGNGVSVLEAINAFEKVSGNSLNYSIGPRRQGDVAAIYTSIKKATSLLNWNPQYSINDIMDTAWRWEIERSKRD